MKKPEKCVCGCNHSGGCKVCGCICKKDQGECACCGGWVYK